MNNHPFSKVSHRECDRSCAANLSWAGYRTGIGHGSPHSATARKVCAPIKTRAGGRAVYPSSL